MHDHPLVSIVIPVFNGEDFLDEAIKSAIDQSYDNTEILVINDGSTDNTEKIAMSYGEKIRYFSKQNGGVASALNFAVTKMHGEYFSWLSHDDYYSPLKIELELEAIKNQADEENIVYCNYSLLDQKSHTFSTYKIEDYYSEKERTNGILMLIQRMIGGCTLLVHSNHFKKNGMFNERLHTTQDYDMWFRILRNAKLVHVPKDLVVTRVHENQGSQTIKEFDEEREQLFLNFLNSLSPAEQREIWGSEYTCLQNFRAFFETYSMKKGEDYVKKQLCRYPEPDETIDAQKKAKNRIFHIGNSTADTIAILGAGDYGKRVYRMLHSRGVDIKLFLDNNPQKWGTRIEGIECIPVESESVNKEKTIVIMAAEQYGQMQHQLKRLHFKNVITKMHLDGILYNVPPWKG